MDWHRGSLAHKVPALRRVEELVEEAGPRRTMRRAATVKAQGVGLFLFMNILAVRARIFATQPPYRL